VVVSRRVNSIVMLLTSILNRTSLLVFLCVALATMVPAQHRTRVRRSTPPSTPSQTDDILADAKKLTAAEKKYCLTILKALDGSDVIITTTNDPYRFKDSLKRVIPMTESADKQLHKGKVRDALTLTTLAYLDFGVLISLGATRHTQGTIELTDEQAESLGEMKRRYGNILSIGQAEDLLDPNNVAKLYRHAINLKEALYAALKS
jgi:hypothetical protein